MVTKQRQKTGAEPRITTVLRFGDCELNLANESLLRNGEPVHLTGKAFGVLEFLARHPDELVTKDELLDAVWNNVAISDAALTKRVQEVRQALGDNPAEPEYIETVPRRGYRFLAPAPAGTQRTLKATGFVGRDAELQSLRTTLELARNGERRIVLVAGEPGIGKTAIVERLRRDHPAPVWLSGQCIQQFDTAAPYLPLLDVVQGLHSRAVEAGDAGLLARYAPSWLRMVEPSRATTADSAPLQSLLLRELATLLEEFSRVYPLVVVLEDLQWADASTLTWLGYFARRAHSCRALLIGSYRSNDHANETLGHVVRELRDHDLVTMLSLQGLSGDQAGELLEAQLGGQSPENAIALARLLHNKANGNPLFIVSLLRQLITSKTLTKVGRQWQLTVPLADIQSLVPESVDRLVDQLLRRLSARDREVLQAASVLGKRVDPAAVADVTQMEIGSVEIICEQLASQPTFLSSTSPVIGEYQFAHDLVREAIYARASASRRQHWHQQAALYENRQALVDAASVAAHYAQAQDYQRAALNYLAAGKRARSNSAVVESANYFRLGLDALRLGDIADDALRLELLNALGGALVATKGYTDAEVKSVFDAASTLHNVADRTQRFAMLHGHRNYQLMSGDLQACAAADRELAALAMGADDPILNAWLTILSGETAYHRGELKEAKNQLHRGRVEYPVTQADPYFDTAWILPDVGAMGYEALVSWELGAVDSAVEIAQQAIVRADTAKHPLSAIFARYNMALVHFRRQDTVSAQPFIDEFGAIAAEHGMELQMAWAEGGQGYCKLRAGDLEGAQPLIESSLDALRKTNSRLSSGNPVSSLALLKMKRGDHTAAVALVDDAIGQATASGEQLVVATLHGMKGFMLFDDGPDDLIDDMERAFEAAVAHASAIGALSWQQRGWLGLALVHFAKRSNPRKFARAQEALAEIHERFTEGEGLEEFQFVKGMLAAKL